jgi:hypothetical protein
MVFEKMMAKSQPKGEMWRRGKRGRPGGRAGVPKSRKREEPIIQIFQSFIVGGGARW